MRILIVEPDAARARRMQTAFVEAHAICDAVDGGEDLERGGLDYDLIVLNADAEPRTLSRLRAAKIPTPVITLAAIGTDKPAAVRLRLFAEGADDVLCWPINLAELVARAKAIIRRCAGHPGKALSIGPLSLDLDERKAAIAGQPLPLTRKEFALAECLALKVNRIVSKTQCLAHMYQLENDEPEIKIIDVFVCKLRKKIVEACPAAGGLIETVWGRGYVLRELPSQAAPLPLAQAA